MAAKVTPQDIEDAGFRAEQFGQPGMDNWTDYLGRLIARASVWAQGRIGAGYAAIAIDTAQGEYLRQAEQCWVTSKLWTARAGFVDSNAASSLENLAATDRRQYLEAGANAMTCAEDNLQLAIGGSTAIAGTGVALVGVETGPFARRLCTGWSP